MMMTWFILNKSNIKFLYFVDIIVVCMFTYMQIIVILFYILGGKHKVIPLFIYFVVVDVIVYTIPNYIVVSFQKISDA